ncbi:hypothetical protein CGZ95_06955 [Enemella evansiae]|uniref:Fic family protein n=1 Tax=Enemella evansiae TaxID=2016499 RepID=UPI000B97C7A0|nr:Fic family protein [Enemella evansiae]OYO01514.1 hypothetical protein CGZ95_06955 [Enemella evansiae]
MHHAAQEFAIGVEPREWDRDPDRAGSRRQRLAARGRYQAAIPATITRLTPVLDGPVQAEAEDAVREVARFDAEVTARAAERARGEVATSAVEVAPLASVLLRTESASSSEIEGITAGARALALAAVQAKVGPNARLVTANVVAMQRAIELADDISIGSILAAHDALLAGHEYAAPGQFREVQVWIGGHAVSPHTATFVPPHHSRIPGAMADLMAFVQRADLPVLIQAAIAHAQFETIHPFNDGNGRVGRMLVQAMLRRADVTRRVTLPVSAGLLADTGAYFAALTDYRAGEIEPIVRQFTEASFRAVNNGRLLVDELEGIHDAWLDRLPSRRGSAARRLLPHLLNQPAVTVGHVEAVTGVALSAAQRAVQQLEDAGIIAGSNVSRRNRVWLAGEVIDALDAFAERAGRRG